MTRNNRTNCTLSISAKDAKLRGVANAPEGSAALQRDHNSLEKWANRNLINFRKEKCQVMPLHGEE